jgi:hypothetical protein
MANDPDDPYEKGLEELLDQLRDYPKIVKELTFERNHCKQLLVELRKKKAPLSKPVRDFLDYVRKSDGGYSIAQCFSNTQWLCAKGTAHGLCAGSTGPPHQ